MSDLPAILGLKYDFSDNELLSGFEAVELKPFAQETEDWTNPVTGEFFKATFDYYAQLLGVRKKDHQPFLILVRMDHKMIEREEESIREAYVKSVFVNAILVLSEYANCDCITGHSCERHSR